MKKLFFSLLLLTFSNFGFSQLYSDLEIFCKEIQNEVDANTGGMKYYSPYENPIYIKKLVTGGKEDYIMTVNVIGPAENTGKGVTILLGRGYKIVKEIPTEVYTNEKGEFVHYATFHLNKNDISMLKNYIISTFSVYMYTAGMSEKNVKYQGYMHCLSKK